MKTTLTYDDIFFKIEVDENKYTHAFYFDIYDTNDDPHELVIEGEVKWDGCANWRFIGYNNCALHTCGLGMIDQLSEVMRRCWLYTQKNLATWGNI